MTLSYDQLVTMSHERAANNRSAVVFGQSGSGKSTLGITLSRHFRDKDIPQTKYDWKKAKGKPLYLCDDLLWMSNDDGATDPLKQRGITVPEFDVKKFMTTEKLWKAGGFTAAPDILGAIEVWFELAAMSKASWLVIDTLSELDGEFDAYFDPQMPMGRDGEPNTIWKYGKIKNQHRLFRTAMSALGKGVIYLCHGKANVPVDIGDKVEAKKKRELTQKAVGAAGGEIGFKPDITGAGAGFYIRNASLVLMLEKTTGAIVNGKRQEKRELLTCNVANNEAKDRFDLILAEREPAHLGKILEKIA